MARRRSFPRAGRVTKKNLTWVAGLRDFDVRSSGAQTVSNGIALLPALDTGVEPGLRNVVKVRRVLILGSLTRVKTEVITGIHWNVSRQQVDSLQIPLQVFNPAATDPVRLAGMSIMRRGMLDIPANIFDAAGVPGLSREAKCFTIDFKPNTTMRRNSEELGLRFGCAVNDVAIHVELNFFILLEL